MASKDAHCVVTYRFDDRSGRVRVWNNTSGPAPKTIRLEDGRTATRVQHEAPIPIASGLKPDPSDLFWGSLLDEHDVLEAARARWATLDANERSRFGDDFWVYAGDAFYRASIEPARALVPAP